MNSTDILDLSQTYRLAQPYKAPILSASFKLSPEDFQVDEIMDVAFSGEGEHLWLLIEKCNMNTAYVAEQLAKWANVPKRDIGYSGMKDRQAVTTQWFSVRIPKKQMPATEFEEYIKLHRPVNSQESAISQPKTSSASAFVTESLSVLKYNWHSKKLNRGTHRANRFTITLRQVLLNTEIVSNQDELSKTLKDIASRGVPNYFGEQRFGYKGNNIQQALNWFESGLINGRKPHPKKSRDIQSILLSAARSTIFNQILAHRVTEGTWNSGMDGEVFNLNGSGSVFSTDQYDDALHQRVLSGDIHPTAPLWGINNDKVSGAAKVMEETIVRNHPILAVLATGLEQKQIKTRRRALRLIISEFSTTWVDDTVLALSFTLPTGSFATSMLTSIVQNLGQATN